MIQVHGVKIGNVFGAFLLEEKIIEEGKWLELWIEYYKKIKPLIQKGTPGELIVTVTIQRCE